MPVTPRNYLILDGGLATQLEARGHRLNDALWSARLLHEQPDVIEKVHLDFLRAGADIICTASYQATIDGFMKHGLDRSRAGGLIQLSVSLCKRARDRFDDLADPSIEIAASTVNSIQVPTWFDEQRRLRRRLIAASVGPYGAYLANGAEYTGDYNLDLAALIDFHHQRWMLLADWQPDLMLCETVPSFVEARALAEVAATTPGIPTWISFSCRDTEHISDGTPIADCAKMIDQSDHVHGIGINCTPPQYLAQLIVRVRKHTDKPIMAYPNSGESYDAASKTWSGDRDPSGFAMMAQRWVDLGAVMIGGCCRTGPEHIRALSEI